MSRAVLLGTGGNPLIMRYWLENLKTWIHKVDKVYVAVDQGSKHRPYYAESMDFLKNQIKGNKKITLLTDCQGWPDSYKDAFNASKEDLFLIMHDDTYINETGLLDWAFSKAAQGEVVTPLHEIYSPKETVEAMLKRKYPGIFPLKTHNNRGNTGAYEGYSFLLYLVFISRENLEKTTINFNGWEGEGMGADTGFGFMLELLDKGVKICPIPRFDVGTEPGGEYLHLQNIGNTIPDLIEGTDPISPDWNLDILKLKLEWLDKFMQVEDYHQIPNYFDKAVKRMDYLRSLI